MPPKSESLDEKKGKGGDKKKVEKKRNGARGKRERKCCVCTICTVNLGYEEGLLLTIAELPVVLLCISVESCEQIEKLLQVPNQQRTHNKLPTELRCRNFVNKHRLSIRSGAKQAKTCVQRVHILTELPFCIPPLVVGWPLEALSGYF